MSSTWKLTRRDMLWLLGGSALGTTLSPLPWKLLDDTAIWTQSGSRVAKLPRGPVTVRFAHCPLCPAGCGLRLRCVGGYAVGLAGVARHPRSDGKLCALGLSAHHLRFHRQRLCSPRVQPAPGANAISIDRSGATTLAATWLEAARRTPGALAILDGRPGRTVSRLYRRWLASEGGHYIPAPGWSPFDAFGAMLDEPWDSVGVDLDRTRTLLVFGTPPSMLQSSPGRWQALRKTNPELDVIVVGPPSGAGGPLVRWLPVVHDLEPMVALAIARVVLETHLGAGAADDLCEYAALARAVSPEEIAVQAGWAPHAVRDLARMLVQHGPVAVLPHASPGSSPLGRSERQAILALNVLLGSAGCAGGPVPRLPRPHPASGPLAPLREFAQVPDGALQLLVIDACDDIPLRPDLVRRKLAPEGRVVCLAPFATGFTREADLALPSPAPFEGWTESPATWDAPVESYAIVPPLAPALPTCVEPVEWLQEVAGMQMRTIATWLGDEVRAIASSGRGALFVPETGSSMSLPAGDGELWEHLVRGGCWIDTPAGASLPPHLALHGPDDTELAQSLAARLRARLRNTAHVHAELVLVPFAPRAASGGVLPAVCAKVYRETGLLPLGGDVFLNPHTAAQHGLRDRGRARLASATRSTPVRVRIDAAVPPGIVLAAVGPDPEHFGDPGPADGGAIARLCEADDELVCRCTPVRIEEA